jgi:hypothetical protein
MLRKKAVVIDRNKYLRKLANLENCDGCKYRLKNGCRNLRCGPFAGKTRILDDLKYYYYFDSYAPEEIH